LKEKNNDQQKIYLEEFDNLQVLQGWSTYQLEWN
jgi:hypothetical protein